MFCSKCGKTLYPGEVSCGHCGAPIGESSFVGVPYTSAQARILPGEGVQGGRLGYTRTIYTDIDAEAGAADERTTYRPAYEDITIPQDVRQDMRSAFSGARGEVSESVMEAVDRFDEEGKEEAEREIPQEAEDLSIIRSRPIQSMGQSGISQDVTDYLKKLEAKAEKKNARRLGKTLERFQPSGSQPAGEQPASEQPQEGGPAPEPAPAPEQDVFGEPFEDEMDEPLDERRGLSPRAAQMIKIAAALVAVAAIVVGVIFWVQHVSQSSKRVPIEGVSPSLYSAGLDKIKAHADSTYVKSLLDKYTTDGILTLTGQLEADAKELDALTPAEPSINDPLFLNTLKAVQTNIGNAVTMDALALAQPTADSTAASNARWQLISDSIANLQEATSTQQLEAILGGERISIQTSSPTPSPSQAAYTALTRGDSNEDVRQMQERLWQLGFLQDDRDGKFGNNTYTAVKAFQQVAGLDVTGIADAKTLALLYSSDAPSTQFAQITPAPTAAAETTAGTGETTETEGTTETEDEAAPEGQPEAGDEPLEPAA